MNPCGLGEFALGEHKSGEQNSCLCIIPTKGAPAPHDSNSLQFNNERMKLNYAEQTFRAVLAGVVGCALACPLSGQAAVANVSVGDDFFSPSSTTINVNDQILWTWTGNISHSTTSNTGLWDSGLKGHGFTFSNTFSASGSYPYHCTLHPFMTGTIIVQGANVPPSVAITSPTDAATFAAPWTGTIRAAVSDTDGTVSKVDFFAGATLLGTVANPQANTSFTVTNLAAGHYTLTAVATDSGGAATTSAGVGVTVVTPVAIYLSSPQRVSPSAFQFSYSANPGLTYVVLRSEALASLAPISTNTATSSTVSFLDNNATGAVSFYGVHLMPNP
jgi:plastocyanin